MQQQRTTMFAATSRRIQFGLLAAVAAATTLEAGACGLRWASTGVNSNTLADCFTYAEMALQANGFQNIHKTPSEVTGTHGGAYAAITCFTTQPKHTAMIMIFGNNDATNLSNINAVRTKIAGYAPL